MVGIIYLFLRAEIKKNCETISINSSIVPEFALINLIKITTSISFEFEMFERSRYDFALN